MYKINEAELKEIIGSYGLDDLIFDALRWVEPDTAIYIFHDKIV